MNNPVYQGQHEADQEYVGVGDELPMVLCRSHVESQTNSHGSVTQCPYQKPSIEVHRCLPSPAWNEKLRPQEKCFMAGVNFGARGLCTSITQDANGEVEGYCREAPG